MPNDKTPPIEYVARTRACSAGSGDVHAVDAAVSPGSQARAPGCLGRRRLLQIDNVPPGKYTVESWHEKYGAKTRKSTVEAGKPAKATFKYDGTEKATG